MQLVTPPVTGGLPAGLPGHATVLTQVGPVERPFNVEGHGEALPSSGTFAEQVRQAAELVRTTTNGSAVGVYLNDTHDGYKLLKLGVPLPGPAPANDRMYLDLKLDPPADGSGYVPSLAVRENLGLVAIVTGQRVATFSDDETSAPFVPIQK